jgi:hypothetical protein
MGADGMDTERSTLTIAALTYQGHTADAVLNIRLVHTQPELTPNDLLNRFLEAINTWLSTPDGVEFRAAQTAHGFIMGPSLSALFSPGVCPDGSHSVEVDTTIRPSLLAAFDAHGFHSVELENASLILDGRHPILTYTP